MFDPIEAIQALVRAPSVSTDSKFQEGMNGARDVLVSLFKSMDLAVEVLETPKHPLVMARREGPEEWPHIIIYGHYDVQPPDPLDLWKTDPFDPVIVGDTMYGRGVADNKGPMMVHIAAAAQLLEENPDLPLRLTFLIEGEEEIGSPSFDAILEKEKARLQGDFILLSDTMSPSVDQISVTTGLRGIMSLEFEVEGPSGDLHSGLHGGAVYNPIRAAAKICAGLHDEDGRVTVSGFYDAVIQPQEWAKAEIDRLEMTTEEYAQSIGIPKATGLDGLNPAQVVRLMPTLEFNGIGGGYQGVGEKTIIPSKAFVKVTCRLVANQDPQKIAQSVEAKIRELCPEEVRLTLKHGHSGPPYHVIPAGRPGCPPDQNQNLNRAFRAVEEGAQMTTGKDPLFLSEGGSVPIIGTLRDVLGMDSLMLGMFTPGSNLHAPNENFDLPFFQKGIQISRHILKSVAKKE